MNLSFAIPGKIWWIHNFLDKEVYKGIHNAIIKERNKINLHGADDIFHPGLIKNITPPMRVEVRNYEPFDILKNELKSNPYCLLPDFKIITTSIHYMKRNSGINWHDDSGHSYGATYYINNRWNKDWGGELMFSDGTGSGFLPYVGNSLVIVKAPLLHKVNPVVTDIMPRISVQLFMK